MNCFRISFQILENVDSFNLNVNAANGLIKGVAVILNQMPPEQVQHAMKRLCWMQVAPLEAILSDPQTQQQQGQQGSATLQVQLKNTPRDPVVYLDRLAAVFRAAKPEVAHGQQHPCAAVAAELWPYLSRTFHTFQVTSKSLYSIRISFILYRHS